MQHDLRGDYVAYKLIWEENMMYLMENSPALHEFNKIAGGPIAITPIVFALERLLQKRPQAEPPFIASWASAARWSSSGKSMPGWRNWNGRPARNERGIAGLAGRFNT